MCPSEEILYLPWEQVLQNISSQISMVSKIHKENCQLALTKSGNTQHKKHTNRMTGQ